MMGQVEYVVEKHPKGWAVVKVTRSYGMVFKDTQSVHSKKADAYASLKETT